MADRVVNEFTRWQRIEHTFHAVADDAPGPARDARVLDLCGQDAGMAAEIGTLLDADATARTTGDGAARSTRTAVTRSASMWSPNVGGGVWSQSGSGDMLSRRR